MRMKKKRVCIDINSIAPLFRNGMLNGVGRTTLELITAISDIKEEFDFDVVFYSQNTKGYGGKKLNLPIPTFHLYLPYVRNINDIINRMKLKKHMLHYDLYHIPHNADYVEDLSKTIFTIHDLIVYRYPEMWNSFNDERRSYFQHLANNCKAIITCSEYSKNDIINFWHVSPEKIFVIPWGINRNVFKPTSNTIFLQKHQIDVGHYFFCPSCNHARKNLPLLLSSYNKYVSNGGKYQLILLNPNQEELSSFSTLLQAGKIVECRNIEDQDLVALYSNAKASIILSKAEGFGLPILESLACHTPVLSSHSSSLIEAGGDVVDYIYGFNQDAIVAKFFEYESATKKSLCDVKKIESHLDQFSWERCARETMKVYRSLF